MLVINRSKRMNCDTMKCIVNPDLQTETVGYS